MMRFAAETSHSAEKYTKLSGSSVGSDVIHSNLLDKARLP